MLSSSTTLLTEYYGASSLHTGNFGADEILLDGIYQLLQPSLGAGGSLYPRLQLQNPPWRDPDFVHNCEAVANSIYQLLSEFFARYGYWVVFFGVMSENIGIPIPGETVLLFAGFLAYQGEMHIFTAIVTAITGATAGAIGGYVLGRYGGTSVVKRFLARFPRLGKRYDDSQRKFVKYGGWAVFGARFVAGLRVFAGILAGTLRMPFSTFLLFSFTGAVCWALVIGYIGFLFGSNWEKLVSFVVRMDRIALALIGGGVVVMMVTYLMRRRNRRSNARPSIL